MARRNALVSILVALLVVTAGCSGVGDSGSGAAPQEGAAEGDYSGADGDAGQEQAESSDGASDAANGDDLTGSRTDRAEIRTGEVDLVVDEYGTANDRVREVAGTYDGFITDSNRRTAERYNESWTRGHVTIRVPTEHFDAAFRDVQEVGTVRQASRNSKDVTDQLVDIEARLRNLRAERDRLRTLYEEANETEDVLAVQRELSRVQEEIERLEARQRQLQDQVAYATITVTLAEEEPEPPEDEEPAAWYDTGLLSAFLESTSGVATAVRALAVAFAYVAPYLLAFGAPIAGAVYVAWNREKLPGAL